MENSKIQNLPILQHFEGSQIGKSVDSFRKGEKGLFWFLKLGAMAAIAWGLWVYVLPAVFLAVAKLSAIAITVVGVIFLILAAPVIFKGLRRLTRVMHKSIIKHDPFAELEDQKLKMAGNKRKFQLAKGKISQLHQTMQIEAANSEEAANNYQKKITTLHKKAQSLKNSLLKMEEKLGVKAKGEDSYIHDHNELLKVVSEAGRIEHQLKQEKDFVSKYGSRAVIMKKFGQKLSKVETAMDIKILDFDATIQILKKDHAFAQKSREATDTAKSAMMFTTGWEVEYALDVVTTTIAQDIAITSSNLNDIDLLTANYAVDSDELYTNLETLANNISVGKDLVSSANEYNAVDYKLTSNDKIKSGGFGDLY